MARLTTCPDCGAAVSKRAATCARCGCPLKKVTKKRGCLSGCATIGLISFTLALLIGLLLPMRPNPLPEPPALGANNGQSAESPLNAALRSEGPRNDAGIAKPATETNAHTSQVENNAALARIEESFKKSNTTMTKRQSIFQALCMAESRAQWEADRLYAQPERWQENMRYHDEMTPKYEKQVREEYHISEDEADVIATEANIRKWPLPQNSSMEITLWARGMKVLVYANRGDYTYHRNGCPLLDVGKPVVSVSLSEAIAKRTAKPCPNCSP
jgi:hypothetical protein